MNVQIIKFFITNFATSKNKKLRSAHATDPAMAKISEEIHRQQIDFAHRLDVAARSGSREVRAVKIPASHDAWRPPKC